MERRYHSLLEPTWLIRLAARAVPLGVALLLGGLALLAPDTAQARTFYVSTRGSDATGTPGTEAAPFRTIARGSRELAPGDTLLIRAGTYAEAMVNGRDGFVLRNGTSRSAMTRYSAYPGEEVIVRPTGGNFVLWFGTSAAYVEVSGLILDGTNAVNCAVRFYGDYEGGIWARNNRLIRNEIRYGRMGILGGGNEIVENRIHGMRTYGIYTDFDDGLLEGNIIHDNGGYGLHHFQQNHDINGWVIRNNVFFNNGDAYYPLYAPYNGTRQRPQPCIVLSRGSSQFYNNVVYDNCEVFALRRDARRSIPVAAARRPS